MPIRFVADDELVNSPVAYWSAVVIGAALCAALCLAARRRPGAWTAYAGRAISLVLLAVAVVFFSEPFLDGSWSWRTSVPLALCDVALFVAAVACWKPQWQLPVELTYFWGMAGTMQAVVTPDLRAGFPSIEFLLFVIGHLGIVTAALFLVIGLKRRPRPGSVRRVFTITIAYTAFVGLFDWLTGANYMYLRAIPRRVTLLSYLGPWPWYIVSGAAMAFVLLILLDAPFRRARSSARNASPSGKSAAQSGEVDRHIRNAG